MLPLPLFVVFASCVLVLPISGKKPEPGTAVAMDIGGGVKVFMDPIEGRDDESLFERTRLRLDFNGMGISLGKASDREALAIGYYVGRDTQGNGRKLKMGQFLIPAVIGFKATTLVVMALFAVTALVIKSILVAKIALIVAALTLVIKLFGGTHAKSGGYNFSPHSSELHPIYAEYPGDVSELGYLPTGGGQYVAYANPEENNSEVSASSHVPLYSTIPNGTQLTQRRKDSVKRKGIPVTSYITVKRKAIYT